MGDARRGPRAIWAVGGGKGGTGKTLLASNMAVSLAKRGFRVLAVDADVGGSNLHTCLGVERPRYGLGSFFRANHNDLKEFMEDTGVANLWMVSGTLDFPVRGPTTRDMNRLRNAIRRADFDYVILDIGSGTSQTTMELFLMAGVGIYVLVPEPTSIENTYRFLKEALYWSLVKSTRKKSVKAALFKAFHTPSMEEFQAIPQFLRQLSRTEPLVSRFLRSHVDSFRARLVLNQVRRYEDVEIGFSVRSAVHKYFGLRVDYSGYVSFDERVIQCVRARKSLLQTYPDSNAAKCIENLTQRLLEEGQMAFEFF
jgi:flagellar biosynthesis protein FlhG